MTDDRAADDDRIADDEAADRPAETDDAGYGVVAVLASAVVGLVVAFVSVWLATGTAVWYEELFRTGATIEGGGVGTDWTVGNTIPALDFLIALVHAADVIMGVFILIMVFVHWASFRRLADQMRPARARDRPGEVAADGGEAPQEPRESSDPGPNASSPVEGGERG